MDENGFEIGMGSHEGLQGGEQEDPALRDERKLEARERPGMSWEKEVDRRLRHDRTIVTTTKETAVFNCGHMVIDSTPVEEQHYVQVTTQPRPQV